MRSVLRARDTSVVRRILQAEHWDPLVQSFSRYDVRQGFTWGRLRAEQGWRPARFAVFRGGEPLAACSVLAADVPGLGAVLYAPRGPLFDPDAPEALGHLFDALRAFGRRCGAVCIRMSPSVPCDDLDSVDPLHAADIATSRSRGRRGTRRAMSRCSTFAGTRRRCCVAYAGAPGSTSPRRPGGAWSWTQPTGTRTWSPSMP